MDSNDLRIFRAVAVAGSITHAAEQLGYVQSNVTTRIRQLESELGTKLFYRQSRGMTLTPSGERLLVYAEKVLQLMEDAKKAMTDSGEPSGALKLGACHTAAAVYVPKILSAFHHQYAHVDLSLVTGHSDDLVQKVLHHELDGAFVQAPVTHPDIVEEVVFREELVLVTPNAAKDPNYIRNRPILMNTTGCLYRAQIEDWLKAEGIMEPRRMEFTTMDAIIGGIMADLGYSLVPKSSVATLADAGLVNTFPVPRPYRLVNTGFVRHKEALLTSSLMRFVGMLHEYEHAPAL